MKRYDAICIGAGQAAPFIAAHLAGEGKQVALIEGHKIGGSCVNYGCIPTKQLVASAHAIHMARQGAKYGFSAEPIVDFNRVMERQQNRVKDAHGGMDGWMRGIDTLDVYDGYGHFEESANGTHHVRVGDDVIESEAVYLNTGTAPFVPNIPGLDAVDYLDNRGILALEELPQHLIVLGGGYIGLEFGQAFRRFGSQVTIIEAMPQIMVREDADVSAMAKEVFENEGIRILVNNRATQITQDAQGKITVTVQSADGQESTVSGSHLLVAIGRKPASANLNLDAAGVKTNERGYIQVDDHLQTNVSGIYAVGDVNGLGAFTHTSYQDHEIIIDNMQGGSRKVSERNMAYAVYIDPPLGRVGMSEQQARESGRPVLAASKPFAHMARAIEQGETAGVMKLMVDGETEQFLGASILGYQADDVVQVISYYMATGASYKIMKNALPIHPTISEFFPTLLGDLKPLE